jgi:dermatan 4-sulfotransferase 1
LNCICLFQLSSEERLSNLKRHCDIRKEQSWSSLSLEEKRATSRITIVDDEHGILYCFFPKVACSNWKRVFLVLAGRELTSNSIEKVDHKKFKFLSDLPPLGIEWRLKTYYKFLFVREPLERIVSAYRDKFLVYKKYFRKRWGSKIVKEFRKKSKHRNEDEKTKDVPSLSEFFQYLVSTKPLRMDIHWMPYKVMSQPCAISYDFIGSFDTLQHDAHRVLRQLHIEDKVQFPRKQPYYKMKPSNTSFDHLLSQVPKPLLRKVVQKYIEDYELFSFPPPRF